MRIEQLNIYNWMRLGLVQLDLSSAVVHLFAGLNEAGKSSLSEAIRFALYGETDRVSKKAEYKALIRDGAKAGQVEVTVDGRTVRRDIATGTVVDGDEPGLPLSYLYALDSQRLARLSPVERRARLMEILSVSINAADVRRRMQAHGVDDAVIERVLPLLRSGFEAAHKECGRKASEARGAWKAVTGENYGSRKAAEWKAAVPAEYDPAAVAERRAQLLQRREVESESLKAWQRRVAMLELARHAMECPHCGTRVAVTTLDGMHPPKQILTAIEQAKPSEKEFNEAARHVTGITIALAEIASDLRRLDELEQAVKTAEDRTAQASALHQEVEMWVRAEDLLRPDGIPSEILADKLTPLNDRLARTAQLTGWGLVQVMPDMEIRINSRPYALHSESARWRADAALAEAVSALSGMRILLLDRFDVLDPPSRSRFVAWLHHLATSGEYDTVLVMGTLKERPARLPPTIAVHWLADGELQDEAPVQQQRIRATG